MYICMYQCTYLVICIHTHILFLFLHVGRLIGKPAKESLLDRWQQAEQAMHLEHAAGMRGQDGGGGWRPVLIHDTSTAKNKH